MAHALDEEILHNLLTTHNVECDPYTHCAWSIGSGDDFICLDYADLGDDGVILMAVCNSETGHFTETVDCLLCCQDAEVFPEAQALVARAREWCATQDFTDEDELSDDGQAWLDALQELLAERTTPPIDPIDEYGAHESLPYQPPDLERWR